MDWTDTYVTIFLVFWLLWLSVIDIRTFRLPDALTIPYIFVGFFYVGYKTPELVAERSVAALVAFLAFYLLDVAYQAIRHRPGIGLGDAKLMAGSGVWLGGQNLPVVVLISCGCGFGIVALQKLRGRSLQPETALPFGPAIAIATLAVWIASHR